MSDVASRPLFSCPPEMSKNSKILPGFYISLAGQPSSGWPFLPFPFK
jgi:hypothetical protein